jgi:hypothetical protein
LEDEGEEFLLSHKGRPLTEATDDYAPSDDEFGAMTDEPACFLLTHFCSFTDAELAQAATAENFGGFVLKKAPTEPGTAGEFEVCDFVHSIEREWLIFVLGEQQDASGRPRTKKEVMEEVIAKSKFYKAQRQAINAESAELVDQLDNEARHAFHLLHHHTSSTADADFFLHHVSFPASCHCWLR